MKTYTTEITEPRLKIERDENSESPREWSNIGKFIVVDRNYQSPDDDKEFKAIVEGTGLVAKSQEHHIELITRRLEALDHEVCLIVPICKYEHSGVSYKVGSAFGFDYSNNGFYIVTEETLKEIGTPNEKEAILECIEEEIETYNKWVSGDVHGFTLFDEQGEETDSCWGFYSLESIKEHLPEEWQNEDLTEYIVE